MMSNQPQLSSEDSHFTSESQKSVVFSVKTKKTGNNMPSSGWIHHLILSVTCPKK